MELKVLSHAITNSDSIQGAAEGKGAKILKMKMKDLFLNSHWE
jgi:hypothetical protein